MKTGPRVEYRLINSIEGDGKYISIHDHFYPLIRFNIMVPCSQERLLGKFEDIISGVKLITAVEIILHKFNWEN